MPELEAEVSDTEAPSPELGDIDEEILDEEAEDSSDVSPEAGDEAEGSETAAENKDEVKELIKLQNESIARLEARNSELLERADKQGNELGQLRKRLQERDRISKEAYEELAATDPLEAARRVAREEMEMSRGGNDILEETRLSNRAILDSRVPNLKELIPFMVEVARIKGIRESELRELADDPYRFPVANILDLAERAEARKELAELKGLKKPDNGKGNNAAKKIQALASRSAAVTGKSGQTVARSSRLASEQIGCLPDAELKKRSAELRKKFLAEA